MPRLPKIIQFNDKLFRQAGVKYANLEIYKYKDERILVEPGGDIFHHYTMQEGYTKGF